MNKIKKALVCLLAIGMSKLSFGAGMQTQLDNIFNSMSNYTEPGAYETAQRSTYYGGHFQWKDPVFQENLMALQLPSARGGCGGIDVFGGSFSFVNTTQFTELLRAVASNAQGYAFQLAMDNMCPGCIKWMNELQRKIQDMNSQLSNSCQLAQGIVNDSSELLGLKKKEENEASIQATLDGVGQDAADIFKNISTAKTAFERQKDADPANFNKETGNVVWKALKFHNAQSWFSGGDDQLIEEIMSMTGSIVKGDLVTGSDGQGQTTQITPLPGNKLKYEDLVSGVTAAHVYNCGVDHDTPYCRITANDTRSLNITGLESQILDAFTGTTGIITCFRNMNLDCNNTTAQQNIIGNLPNGIGSKIFNLAPISPEAATDLVNFYSKQITIEYVHRLVDEAFRATDIALTSTHDPYASAVSEGLKESKKTLDAEYKQLVGRYGSLKDVERYYSDLMKGLEKNPYVTPDQLKKVGAK